MKRVLFFLVIVVAYCSLANAQARGGEVVRKPKTENNQVRGIHSGEHSNSSSKTQIGISRNIDGVTIGSSTKQEVITNLKNRGKLYDLHELLDNYAVILSNGKHVYLGVTWQAVMYKFNNGIVYQVTYIKHGDNTKGANVVFDYVQAINKLRNSYDNWEQTPGDDFNYFSDSRTLIILAGGDPKPQQELSLTIADSKVFHQLNE